MTNRTWRTNIGLRLTQETGAWFEQQCEKQNRPLSNYVEFLIMQEKARQEGSK